MLVRAWHGYAVLGVAAVLILVVLAQGLQLSALQDRADRLSGNAAAAERTHQRRLEELRDRTDALTDRVRRSLDTAAIARHVLPSVFRVLAGRSSGTAFAVARAPEGGTYLVTNEHVVDDIAGDGKLKLTRDGDSHDATVVKTDASGDVAVLKTSAEIPLLRFANAPPISGEPIVVVGAPVGLEDTVTVGVVSKIRPIAGRKQEYIQFDAAINPGNSGGPVVDAGGRVVGVATAKAMDAEGIGFALPIGVACDSFDFIC
ncbi:MAG: S1C family serine protease [Micromonosporaceae bacterium]